MAKSYQLFAKSGFKSFDGHDYTLRIYKSQEETIESPLDFLMPADDPASIQWSNTDKTDTICSSSCSIKCICATKFDFLSLATADPASVRLDIRRDGSMFWSGLMDSDFYEEPFSDGLNYAVRLSFTDLGVLHRLPFALIGVQSIMAIIESCLRNSGVASPQFSYLISTQVYGQPVNLSKYFINTLNFYDEDNEPMKQYDVLEEILKPFSLRLRYYAGTFYIYDLNYFATQATPGSFAFSRKDHELSFDTTYKKLTVTFSPFNHEQILSNASEIKKGAFSIDDTANADTAWFNRYTDDQDEYWAIFHGNMYPACQLDASTVKSCIQSTGLIGPEGFCTIVGCHSFTGINVGYKKYYWVDQSGRGHWTSDRIGSTSNNSRTVILRTKPCYVLRLNRTLSPSSVNNIGYKLHVKVPAIISVLDNPWVQEEEVTYINKYDAITENVIQVIQMAKISLLGDDGLTYYYNGTAWTTSERYCSLKLRIEGTGDSCDNILPVPPVPGNLTIELRKSYSFDMVPEPTYDENTMKDWLQWYLVGIPSVTVSVENTVREDMALEDVETKAEGNAASADDLDISTSVGTSYDVRPCAYGVMFRETSYLWYDTTTKEDVTLVDLLPCSHGWIRTDHGVTTEYNLHQMTRGGVTGTPEELLLRTLAAQYTTPHMQLSGTCSIFNTIGSFLCTDMPGTRRFFCMGETLNLHDDTSKATFSELSPDTEGTLSSTSEREVTARPRARRLQENNLALVKKEARIKY